MISLSCRYSCTTIALVLLVISGLCAVHSQERILNITQLVQSADVVVMGKVVGVTSEWNADKTRIRSIIRVTVAEQYKGDALSVPLTIVTPGGEIDGVGELYSHVAKFKVDEEVVVFVRRDKENRFRVTGGSQGKLTVTRDGSTGRATVLNTRSLDDFVREIKTASAVHDGN